MQFSIVPVGEVQRLRGSGGPAGRLLGVAVPQVRLRGGRGGGDVAGGGAGAGGGPAAAETGDRGGGRRGRRPQRVAGDAAVQDGTTAAPKPQRGSGHQVLPGAALREG